MLGKRSLQQIKQQVLEMLDHFSGLTKTPLFVLDENGMFIWHSKYFFKADITTPEIIPFWCRLAVSGKACNGKTCVRKVGPGMDALISPFVLNGQNVYLIAGFFIDEKKEEKLQKVFGAEISAEFLAINLTPLLGDKRDLFCNLASSFSSVVKSFAAQHEVLFKIENVLITLQQTDKDFSKRPFEVCFELSPFTEACWAAIDVWDTETKHYAYICTEGGAAQYSAHFPAELSRWVMETGRMEYISDLNKDLRAQEFLRLEPKLKCLVSYPLRSGSRAWGVLHVGFCNEVSWQDFQVYSLISTVLGLKEHMKSCCFAKESGLESTIDLIINLLNYEEDDRVFDLLVSTLAKLLNCRSMALFIKEKNTFNLAASSGMHPAVHQLDSNLVQECYLQNNSVRPILDFTQRRDNNGYIQLPVFSGDMLGAVFTLGRGSALNEEEHVFMQRVAELLGVFLKSRTLKINLEKQKKDFLQGMVAMLESHLPWLNGHAAQTERYAVLLGRAAGLSETELCELSSAAMLHNVGKIKIPTSFFIKSGKLTLNEKKKLERYVKYGAEILTSIPSLACYAPVLLQLEENVDASGYPCGLKNVDIHPHARIIRIASTFASLTSSRSYRGILQIEKALDAMEKDSGRKFCPNFFFIFKKTIIMRSGGRAGMNEASQYKQLTPREHEVLKLIAHGNTNGDIAAKLVISEKTVKVHVSNILQKLGLKDRTQAAIFFLKNKSLIAQK